MLKLQSVASRLEHVSNSYAQLAVPQSKNAEYRLSIRIML